MDRERYEAHGTLIQCAKCGRAVWSDHVNTSKRCVICSPPRADKDEPDEEVAAA